MRVYSDINKKFDLNLKVGGKVRSQWLDTDMIVMSPDMDGYVKVKFPTPVKRQKPMPPTYLHPAEVVK